MSLEVSSSLSRHKYHSVYSQCFLSWFFETTKNTKLSLFDVCGVLPTKVFKGQLILKCLFGIFNSFKKRTKKFDLTTIQWYLKSVPKRHVSLVSSIVPKNERKNSTLLLWYLKSNCFRSFLGRIEDTKKTFRN